MLGLAWPGLGISDLALPRGITQGDLIGGLGTTTTTTIITKSLQDLETIPLKTFTPPIVVVTDIGFNLLLCYHRY